jgi:hypothetical protein
MYRSRRERRRPDEEGSDNLALVAKRRGIFGDMSVVINRRCGYNVFVGYNKKRRRKAAPFSI